MTSEKTLNHQLNRPITSKFINAEAIGYLNLGRCGLRPVFFTHSKGNSIDDNRLIV
jgi:hypothetical protein